ncbi:MAG: septum formation initiator family protein [Desulfuromonas sp.]|nr:septum formation initiator family protein [Desulfuromonas sp.]
MTSKPISEQKTAMIRSRPLCLVAVVVVGMSCALFGEKGALHLNQIRQQQEQLLLQSQQLSAANSKLRAEIDALQHDDSYLEQVARSRLSLVRDGELVYQFSPRER